MINQLTLFYDLNRVFFIISLDLKVRYVDEKINVHIRPYIRITLKNFKNVLGAYVSQISLMHKYILFQSFLVHTNVEFT